MTPKPIALALLTIFFAACSNSPLPPGAPYGDDKGLGVRGETPPPPTSTIPFDQTQGGPAAVPPSTPTLTALPPTSPPQAGTPTETAPATRTSPLDGMPQVYVPDGAVRMGGLDVYSIASDELPAHTVSLDAFWFDQLEVTNAMYMLCVQAGGCSPPRDWASGKRFSYFNNEEYKDYPVVHVTWEQASAYCAWAGRRLPSEAEWERAARGDDFRNFPWGDEPPSETYANFNRLVDDTSRVGSYAAGAGPFGALDMAGNVWEWVADLYGFNYYSISPENNPTGPERTSTNRRVIRGGSFQDGWVNLRVSKRGSAQGPVPNAPFDLPGRDGEHSSKIGFRCTIGE